jgi:hypothetical protein
MERRIFIARRPVSPISSVSELVSLEAAAKGERTRKKKFRRPDDIDRHELMGNDGDEVEEREGQRVGDKDDEDER